MKIPARQKIYEMGSVQDNCFLILKGRVAFEITNEENLPIIVGAQTDGHTFGNTVSTYDESSSSSSSDHDSCTSTHGKIMSTSCLTIEDSEFLVLDSCLLQRLEKHDLAFELMK